MRCKRKWVYEKEGGGGLKEGMWKGECGEGAQCVYSG